MTIKSEKTAEAGIRLSVSGRLDTASSPMLEKKLKQCIEDNTELCLDFSDLTYISSIGLRVLIQAQKAMKEQNRKLVIKNINDSIREIFKITGFINMIEQE